MSDKKLEQLAYKWITTNPNKTDIESVWLLLMFNTSNYAN